MPQLRSDRGASLAFSIEAPIVDIDRPVSPETSHGKLKPGPGRSAADVARHQRGRIHRAMIDLVAEHGYDAVTVRSLTKASEVSSRSFYQHYSDKQDCFWSVHQRIVRRMLRCIAVARAEESDAGEGLARLTHAIVREWSRDPRAARLMLVDANFAGPNATAQVRNANRLIRAKALEDAGPFRDAWMDPFLVDLVIGGLTSVARSRSLRESSMAGLEYDLVRWASSYWVSTDTKSKDLDLSSLGRCATWPSSSVPSSNGRESGTASPSDDRALLLSAISKLAATGGAEKISLEMILAAAGVSRSRFYQHFAQVDDALVAAMETHAGIAIEVARAASKSSARPSQGAYRAIVALGNQVASQPAFARLCFGGIASAQMSPMRCRDQFVAEFTALLEELMPTKSKAERLALNASVGAVFESLQGAVTNGRTGIIPRSAGAFAYFTMAPLVGSSIAVTAVREEADYAAA